MKSTFLSRFTPSLMPQEALEAIFVQREREARRTVELVRESVLTAGKSHTLFVGPRGIGKTHLVSLIYHRLRAMDDLQGRLLIAWLREEEWGVSSFLDVLQRILRALAEDDPALAPRLGTVQAAGTEAAAERVARDLLREIVGERTLLLLAESLDDLFDGIGEEGQKRFRAFLQDTRFATILATSQGLFSGVSRQAAPFYNFFRVQHLPGLSLDDAVLLLTKIAELEEDTALATFLHTPAGRARVRAVHHLAGGSPRVYVIFSEFLTREALDELVAPFLKMLDELTPYYQSKMRSLSPQQRKIVEILSDARGAIPVKQIAARSFLTHQTVSSQLQELRERGYATAHKIGRESFYELQEPLMRLCLEVKKQRGEPITLFVDFLRLWCTREDLERRLSLLPAEAMLTQWHLREALRQSEQGENLLVVACMKDWKTFFVQGNHEKALQVSEELIAIRGEASDWGSKGWHLEQLGRYEEALAALDQALALNPRDASAWTIRGEALANLNHQEEALSSFEQALTINPENADAWYNKGIVSDGLEHHGEALVAFEEVLRLTPNSADAWRHKGSMLSKLGRYEEAVTAYGQTVSLDPHSAEIWGSKGAALFVLGRHEEALASVNHALEIDVKNIPASTIKSYILYEEGHYEEALVALDHVLTLRPTEVLLWRIRVLALIRLQRYEEALVSIKKLRGTFPEDSESLRLDGLLSTVFQYYEEALEAFEQLVILEPIDSDAWDGKGMALQSLGRNEQALASFNEAIRLNDSAQASRLNRAETLLYLGRWPEAFEALADLLPQCQDEPQGLSDFTELALSHLLAGDQAHWQAQAETLARLYGQHGSGLVLGQALTATIPELASSLPSPAARRLWQETWQTAAGDNAEMRLPLRLLDTAIRYHDSGDPPDPRIPLELPVEERSILESLLGISQG